MGRVLTMEVITMRWSGRPVVNEKNDIRVKGKEISQDFSIFDLFRNKDNYSVCCISVCLWLCANYESDI